MATSKTKFTCLDILFENTEELLRDVTEIILRFANNIINNPEIDKYRRIRVANAIVADKLLPVDGALQCLLDMGFTEDGKYFTLPKESSLDSMISIRNEIVKRRKEGANGVAIQVNRPEKKEASNENMEAVTKTEKSSPNPRVASNSDSSQAVTKTETLSTSRRVASNQEETASKSETSINRGAESNPQSREDPQASAPNFVVMQHPQYPADIRTREALFLRKLLSSHDHVLIYERPELQERARSVTPVVSLRSNAVRRLTDMQQASGGSHNVGIQDILLLELLAWFKTSFFSWVDSPRCDHCRGEARSVGMATPTDAELTWGAERVENYQCTTCSRFTRFPRYNHPGKLLETRRGRCGEWANCFTLCCRALGFDARYVLDWTDHVWTEVYSSTQKRWLHCDPCENICDKPLLYESGWGKQLSYVIAFSKDEAQDVTWRYTSKPNEIMQRRIECRESVLLSSLEGLTAQRQSSLPAPRQTELLHRLAAELVEFLTPLRPGQAGQLGGRVSGSLAWRQARGETGAGVEQGCVIHPTQSEIAKRTLHVRYCAAADRYERPNDQSRESVAAGAGNPTAGREELTGWRALVYEARDVARKEEQDWRMVYLARREGADTAKISWKFDLTGLGVAVDTVELRCGSKCFQNGRVAWRLCAVDTCLPVHTSESPLVVSTLSGQQTLTLTAELSGGSGDAAWQHTQLFRQSLDATREFPLDVKIHLKRAS